MKPAAMRIYQMLFPGCDVQDLREDGVNVHILDKEFGIDSLMILGGGQWISLQEKYRRAFAMKYMDFTQEYKNACGTQHESEGEWFKLGAQLYFYGWANDGETEFAKWVVLDIPRYKALVEKRGGLSRMGKLCRNNKHGRASFYSIPIAALVPAVFATNISSLGVRWTLPALKDSP
jgi:hypothetical protein